jgi:type IV secretory pathway VirD2 relaxase
VALRGVNSGGEPINLSREYIKTGIRVLAEERCTKQLGYRTELDAASAERREVSQQRYTSLDRVIARAADKNGNGGNERFFVFMHEPAKDGSS